MRIGLRSNGYVVAVSKRAAGGYLSRGWTGLDQARIGATTARSNTLCTRAAKNDASTPAAKEKDSKAPAAKVVEVKAVAKVGAPGVVYVGNGKFVKEDTKGVQSGTGKGDLGALIGMTGGWAGGEKALDAFRTELKAGPKEAVFTDPAEKKVRCAQPPRTVAQCFL